MKKLFLALLFALPLYSCVTDSIGYPKYEYAIKNYVPDSLKDECAKYVRELVSATDQHLSAGELEEPWITIRVAKQEAEEYFSVRGEGLKYIKWRGESNPEFIPLEKLTEPEKRIFTQLKCKN